MLKEKYFIIIFTINSFALTNQLPVAKTHKAALSREDRSAQLIKITAQTPLISHPSLLLSV